MTQKTLYRLVVTLAVYGLSLVVVGVLAAVTVLVVAGPHAGLLPAPMEPIMLAFGWLVTLVLPVWIARRVWRRLDRR